ncbi:MAG: hypothetical protein ABJ205_11705 [Erythrobacter sp.]|uniref:hypothetical protein n=1 Tax=Erythrobacter sp. TaxID=1042 RepID=UPI0032635C76
MSQDHVEPPIDDSEIAVLRAGAQLIADDALRSRDYLTEQFASLARWLIASLLAVNSGALIAVLNSDALSLSGKQVGGGVLAAALCAVLISAYANMRSAKALMPKMTMQQDYWAGVALTGERDEVEEANFSIDWDKDGPWEVAADWLAWISFVLFVSGLVVCGFALEDKDSPAGQSVEITCDLANDRS